MKRSVLVACAIVLALSAAGCTSRNDTVGRSVAIGKPTAGNAAAEQNPALSSAINGFGFALLGDLDANGPGAVTVISPVSVHTALTMAANGADGETLREMRRTLRLNSLSEKESNQDYADLIALLTSTPDVRLDIANSLWLDEGLTAKQAFLDADRQYFGAELRTLDLQTPEAPRAINAWVKKNTGGKIDRIVPDRLDGSAVLELLNATYFKADWQTPFEAEATHKEPFHLLDGSQVNVDMVSGWDSWAHVMNARYEAIRLPYANGSTSMIVVKTSPLSSASASVPDLTAEEFEQLRSELTSAEPAMGQLVMPKVELRWESSLISSLERMGIVRAFDEERADLGRLTEIKPAWFGSVQHKTYLRVDEKGTEAAAVTAVGVLAGSASAPSEEPFHMTVDSPYLIAIVDNPTGTVLFLASIRDPRSR